MRLKSVGATIFHSGDVFDAYGIVGARTRLAVSYTTVVLANVIP